MSKNKVLLFRNATLAILLAGLLLGASTNAGSTPYKLDSIAVLQFGDHYGSDCWGWVSPSGDQYAIMGTEFGLVFVSIETLQPVDTISGIYCLWQDMATVGNICYAVSECGSGLRVIDLQYLPDSAHLISVLPTDGDTYMSSHNLVVDSVAGFLYLEGKSVASESAYIHDISNPANPVHVGGFGYKYGIHDLYVNNDTAYLAEGSKPYFSIWDMSNKALPQLISRIAVPDAGYVHNIWPSEDQSFLVTTEETGNKSIKIWDTRDYENIRLAGEILAPSGLAHNAHIIGNTVYLSHYESGVFIVDVSVLHCPTEIASFDTWAASDNPGGNGAWGVFPFTQDSLVYASNLDGSLYILRLREDSEYIPSEPDSDGDSIGDGCDNCPLVANPDQPDIDFDGTGDDCDNCPTTPNADQEDLDGDGVGDVCDVCPAGDDNIDSDIDNVADACDNCPEAANENQIDSDADGIGNLCDNCPDDANFDQLDRDGDGIGDICDACPDDPDNDIDGDFVCGDIDNCPTVANPSQEDANGDEVGDACCCLEIVGNVDSDAEEIVDIGDLTVLIDHLFISFAPLNCPGEANVDVSADMQIDIGDLTSLIDFLFITSNDLAACQ